VGVTQPGTFAHAAAIAAAQGDTTKAREWASRATSMCSASAGAEQARAVLAQLESNR
jgi:hypothetical protein